MKKYLITLPLIAMLASCGPMKREKFVEIESNETAFVIPLEGDNVNSQERLESVDYLEKMKVSRKRISLEQRQVDTERMWFSYEWIPTQQVITVDRSPVTREWTEEGSKKAGNGKPIAVESLESIGFTVGVNLTAYVDEKDTAQFLYYYRNKALTEVIDQNIRGEIQNSLSAEFGRRDLVKCRSEKNEIFSACNSNIVSKFKQYGITITSFGFAEGLSYEDESIQEATTKTFVAEQSKKTAEFENDKQEIENTRLIGIAKAAREQAEEFAKASEAQEQMIRAEVQKNNSKALLIAAEKWDGSVPNILTIGSSGQNPFLMQLDKSVYSEQKK